VAVLWRAVILPHGSRNYTENKYDQSIKQPGTRPFLVMYVINIIFFIFFFPFLRFSLTFWKICGQLHINNHDGSEQIGKKEARDTECGLLAGVLVPVLVKPQRTQRLEPT
jgi:hypothetical protein